MGLAGAKLGMMPELRFFLNMLKPYRRELALASFLLLACGLASLSVPWFAARVAQSLVDARAPGDLLLAWLGVTGLQALLGVWSAILMGATSSRLIADLGSRIYDHLQVLPLAWHQDRKRGETLSLLTNDVTLLSSFLSGTLVPLAPWLLTGAGALLMLLLIDPRIGLLVAAAVPLFALVLKLATRRLRPLAFASVREMAVKFGIAEQNLSSLPLIKAFNREPGESERYAAQGRLVRDLEIRRLRVESALSPAFRWLGSAIVIGLIWLGSRGIAAGSLSASELVGILLYGLLLTQPVSQLAGAYGQVQLARGSASRLLELFHESPEPDAGTRRLAAVRGELRFESVRFGYPGRRTLLDGLELHVEAGETLAITGANGAGKSTLAHLVLRLIDPGAGRILLDGVDLRELSLGYLRAQIGLVSQNVLLLNASVAENIGFGRAHATREQVERAARQAHAHDFISALPDGYETLVGDEGVRLSGGQKQRIALARALLKDPAILILDEATAMFDPDSERALVADSRELLRRRTVLLITHRPASLALADRVLRLRDGRLHEVAATIPT